METSPIADKSWQPRPEPPHKKGKQAPVTLNKQWKEGGEGWGKLPRWWAGTPHNAASSRSKHTQELHLTTALLSGGWVPETSRSLQYWQPYPRWRLLPWLANPGNPTMSPHAKPKDPWAERNQLREMGLMANAGHSGSERPWASHLLSS